MPARLNQFVVISLALVVSACTPSVDAVVPESEATFDARLLGSWRTVEGDDRAVITRGSGKAYTIVYTSKGKMAQFEARDSRLKLSCIASTIQFKYELQRKELCD